MTGGLLWLLLDASWPSFAALRPTSVSRPLDLTARFISNELEAGRVLLQVQNRLANGWEHWGRASHLSRSACSALLS